MKLTIYTDGGSRGNPGPSASAFVAYSGEKEVGRGSKFLGETTNNVAEYQAILLALHWLQKFSENTPVSTVDFIVDSQLAQRQLVGIYKVKNKNLIKLVSETKNIERNLAFPVKFMHVLRSENKEADSLVNKTLDENR